MEILKRRGTKFNERCLRFAQFLSKLPSADPEDPYAVYIKPKAVLEGLTPLIPGDRNVIYPYICEATICEATDEDIKLSLYVLEVVPWGKMSDDIRREADILELDCRQHPVSQKWNWFIQTYRRWHPTPLYHAGACPGYHQTEKQNQSDPKYVDNWLAVIPTWEIRS